MGGPLPISFAEIEAWMRVTKNILEPRDIEALKLLDISYLKGEK